MKTESQRLPTYSIHDGVVNLALTAPKSWRELTQDELRYVLFLLTRFHEPHVVKTYLFCRLSGLEVIRHTRTGWKCSVLCHDTSQGDNTSSRRRVVFLQTETILGLLGQFDFVDGFRDFQPLRSISDRLRAVSSIRKITFQDYLFAEKYYQLYLMHREDRFLRQLGWILYRDEEGGRDDSVSFDPEELLGAFLWYSDFKSVAAANFPHFFKSSKEGADPTMEDITLGIRAQVRALTDGDITKQRAVFETDCWSALTELDEKAREAEEYKEKMKTIQS